MAFCDRFLIPMAPASLKRWARASPLHAWGAGVALNAAIGRAHGTCAEYIAVPEKQAVALHEKTEFLSGACFGVPLMTAAYGVLGDGAVDGQTILVTGGAGAVGHYAVQVARLNGAQVLTTVSGDEKKRMQKRPTPIALLIIKSKMSPNAFLI